MLMLSLLFEFHGHRGFPWRGHRVRPPCLVFVMHSLRVLGRCYPIWALPYLSVVVDELFKTGNQRKDRGRLGIQN